MIKDRRYCSRSIDGRCLVPVWSATQEQDRGRGVAQLQEGDIEQDVKRTDPNGAQTEQCGQVAAIDAQPAGPEQCQGDQ